MLSTGNTAGKLRAHREGKKNGFISSDGLAGSRGKRGKILHSGFVPISKTSSMLTHPRLNEATLKSVRGLGRERGELCHRIWHGAKPHVRSNRLLVGTGTWAYGKIQLLE